MTVADPEGLAAIQAAVRQLAEGLARQDDRPALRSVLGATIRGILGSRKAVATIAGVVVALAGRVGLDLPEDTVHWVLGLVSAYVLGQGLSDHGKEREMVGRASGVARGGPPT